MADDWTTGPAKWVAVLVLGSASVAGVGWSMWTRTPRWPEIRPVVVEPVAEVRATPSAEAGEAPAQPPEPVSTVPARIVNLNTATRAELELLPGIGPALAGRIIEHRTTNGPFRSVDGLDDVKGIGPRTLEKLRPLVTVGEGR